MGVEGMRGVMRGDEGKDEEYERKTRYEGSISEERRNGRGIEGVEQEQRVRIE